MSRSFSWKHLRRCRPSRVLMSRHTPPWLQVVGHAGNFQVGECGRLLKRFCPREQVCYLKLMDDGLRSFVPTYYGVTRREQQDFNVMDNLLTHFHAPAIMDCKMGSRTYLEEELQERPQPRRDMYLKMVAVDPAAPTGQEREQQAVLKTRYMQWRESLSSTTTLGFRVEGFRKSSGECHTSFKRTRSREQVMEALGSFVDSQSSLLQAYLKRLKHLRNILEESQFFKTHEVVGSSLLFVHDPSGRTGVWMIDFGKTVPLPPALTLDHRRAWMEGNHEDGYLWGLDNLIDVMTDLTRPVRAPPTCDPQE